MIQSCYHAYVAGKANTLAMTVGLPAGTQPSHERGVWVLKGRMPLIGAVLPEKFFNGNSLLPSIEDGENFHG